MKRVSVALAAVAICMLTAANVSAAANVALRGIGLKVGVVNPEDIDMTLGAGLIVDLGTVHPHIALESYAGFWSQTEEFYGSEFRVRDIAIGAKGKYLFTTSNPSLTPFAGAGLGLHFVNAHAETPSFSFGGTVIPGTSVGDTDTELGLDLGGGLRIDTGSQFSFVGEGWFTLVSDVNNFSLMAGAVYMFGR
jgi:Outer membrane protein beta-barrel domain